MIFLLAPGSAGNMTFGGAPSGTVYTSDQNGVVRIANGSAADQAALIAAGCTPLSAIPGEPGERITVSTNNFQLPGDGSIYFDVTNATGAALTLLLPVALSLNQECVVTDEGGNAGTYAITIKSGSTTIDTISVNNGWSKLRWNGAHWLITG